MRIRIKLTFLIGLATVLLLSACSIGGKTADWKVFSIDQEPAFNIQFRLPPRWLVDFSPSIYSPGQWDVTLVPPKCTPDQQIEYQQICVTLIAHIKDSSPFSKETFFDLNSADIPLSQDGSQSAKLLSQESFRVNRLNVDLFNHLIATTLDEVHVSNYFIETDSAYFIFVTIFPYDETENEAKENFELLLGSVKQTR